MKITRLRLLGFKSFVEPTELVIHEGLTGIVGPNGCGKSNLLEALRWVMGETSHKSMRAAAMDDVIFSGTTTRPSRNAAEVTMFVDNRERRAPAEFNDHDILEITRRIEREAGSAYRINSREARARDIKILFEDAATGARSPALVRQGQIGEIVNAKPEQRRRILEDAAGVAGLHSRRHEAELRLRAAEANLARIADVIGALNTQIETLKRQARQARRYKELSAEIRKSEALLAHLAWSEAQALVDTHEAELTEVLARLGAAVADESRAVSEELRHAEVIPGLRETEATRAAILARLKHEETTFEREAADATRRQAELRARLEQLSRDLEREAGLVGEARDTVTRLDDEIAILGDGDIDAVTAEDAARDAHATAETAAHIAEARLTELTQRVAETRARRRSLETGLAERRDAVTKIERQITALETQRREIAARAPDAIKLQATTLAGQTLADDITRVEAETNAAEDVVRELGHAARSARDAAATARLAAQAIVTERDTLARLIAPLRDPASPPIVDGLVVAPGYETALGAALGDDLDAPVESANGEAKGPSHWRLVEPTSSDGALPQDVEPLSRYVSGPPELLRRLNQIGIVDKGAGKLLQPHLRPGQRLVTQEGDLWRWDGFVAPAHGAVAAAQRLALRNRVDAIAKRAGKSEAEAKAAAAAETEAAQRLSAAEAALAELRLLWRDKQSELSRTREQLTTIERAARETEGRISAIDEALERARDGLIEAHESLSEAETALDLMADADELEPELDAARSEATRHRAGVLEARTSLERIAHEIRARAQRLEAARADRNRWAARLADADRQIATLHERHAAAKAELAEHSGLPALIAERRDKLMTGIANAERERTLAAEQLTAAENGLRAATQALKAAQGAVADSRETRARHEAKLEAARQRRQEEARRIRETFDIAPEACLKLAGHPDGAELPALPDVDRQLTRLRADRDRLGGVNLAADEELEKLNEQAGGIEAERADIEQAIAKLRSAIGQLNREAKSRIQDAFNLVDGHFQRLFTTLFNGGEARLEMIESEDPLEGGLEIIAKPPGKKPATLSLLSGGEQTLTALSLIFAVFLTNPSPICVLDEVDAPLDDANVDRFCTLMEKMAAETDTRFLVITHHPMTMVRMNRLFGVTMAEKGVSQLVSVDLETAQSFTAPDTQAGAA